MEKKKKVIGFSFDTAEVVNTPSASVSKKQKCRVNRKTRRPLGDYSIHPHVDSCSPSFVSKGSC